MKNTRQANQESFDRRTTDISPIVQESLGEISGFNIDIQQRKSIYIGRDSFNAEGKKDDPEGQFRKCGGSDIFKKISN